jgi:hypothetical protein
MRGGESFADVRAVWSKNNAIIETLGEKQGTSLAYVAHMSRVILSLICCVALSAAIMRLFPGAIFMSVDDKTGAVIRFDVVSLDLSRDKRLAVLSGPSKHPLNTTVSALRDNGTAASFAYLHRPCA